jgi:hypothetical protein
MTAESSSAACLGSSSSSGLTLGAGTCTPTGSSVPELLRFLTEPPDRTVVGQSPSGR